MTHTWNRPFRTVLFWIHLVAGVTIAFAIVVMSATGVLLAFQPQIVAFVERQVRTVQPPSGAARLPLDEIVSRVTDAHADLHITGFTIQPDPTASLALSLDRGTIYVDPYTAQILGEPSARAQRFFRTIEGWHRSLAAAGAWRTSGKTIADIANAAFLFLTLSGLVLWWPRRWTRQHVKPILWFRRAGTMRAREFNWHHVIGFWSAPILILLTLTGVFMSYPAANRLLLTAAGSASAPGDRDGGRSRGSVGPRRNASTPTVAPDHLDQLVERAAELSPRWSSITVRWPNRPGAGVAMSIAGVNAWNPMARSQVTFDGATQEVIAWEPYGSATVGQRLRGWVRFGHTGEILGFAGQALAAAGSLGALVLVWTGLSLAFRRLFARPCRVERARAA